jgi:hypothetical protein
MRHPEQILQRTVADWLRWGLCPPWYFSAIGHGGGGELRGKILHGMGVKRGIWDFLFLAPDRFVGWIEMKSLRGVLTSDQEIFGDMAGSFGHHTGIARSLEQVHEILLSWNAPLRFSKPSTERIVRGFSNPGDWPASAPIGRRKRKDIP